MLCHCETSLHSLFMLLIFSLNRRSWPRVSITSSAKRTRSGLRLQILSSSSVRPRWESWVTLRRLQHPSSLQKYVLFSLQMFQHEFTFYVEFLDAGIVFFPPFFILMFLLFNQPNDPISQIIKYFQFLSLFFHFNYLILNPLLLLQNAFRMC